MRPGPVWSLAHHSSIAMGLVWHPRRQTATVAPAQFPQGIDFPEGEVTT